MAKYRSCSPSLSTSSAVSDELTFLSEEENVRVFVKTKLSKRLFLGHYQERRYIDHLHAYRDMIVVHSSEVDIQNDLETVRSKLCLHHSDKWIGITNPDMIGAPAGGYCIWLRLKDVAFGFYWFKIKRICYTPYEVMLQVSVVRPVDERVLAATPSVDLGKVISERFDNLKKRLNTSIQDFVQQHSQTSDVVSSSSEDQGRPQSGPALSNSSENEEPKSLNPTTTTQLEWPSLAVVLLLIHQNWWNVLKFMAVAFVASLTWLASAVRYVGDYSIRLTHEFTLLVRAITPITLGVLELIGKVIGGLYLLIAMFFNKGGRRVNSAPSFKAIRQ